MGDLDLLITNIRVKVDKIEAILRYLTLKFHFPTQKNYHGIFYQFAFLGGTTNSRTKHEQNTRSTWRPLLRVFFGVVLPNYLAKTSTFLQEKVGLVQI